MERPADPRGVASAWRALDSGPEHAEGWKTIFVGQSGPCSIRAGRRLPGNEEALLIGFPTIRLPKVEHLPNGRGFLVTEADLGFEAGGLVWIALCRKESGSRELFTVMAEDLAVMLASHSGGREHALFQTFLARIRAWQDFMLKGAEGLLGPEAELGLFGEIHLLRSLLDSGMSGHSAVDCWMGPQDGLQDFLIGSGGIEVKTTASSGSFPAKVGSLDQLSDDLVKPLFLAGVRVTISDDGLTLPDAVRQARDLFEADPAVLRRLDTCLLHAGYFDSAADRYTRRFRFAGLKVMEISEGFPRLTKSVVGPYITKAHYELDLDAIGWPETRLVDALKTLGAIAT